MGHSRNGKWVPLLSVAVAAGLFHPNCRHTLTTWIEGVSKMPKPLDAQKVQQAAKLEEQQRALERKVRKAKRLQAGLQDPEDAKKARAQVREAQKELREFVQAHPDVLRRDPWREKTFDIPYSPQPQKAIMKDAGITMYPVTNQSIIRVQSFDCQTLPAALQAKLKNEHKRLLMLIAKKPLGTEAGATYDLQMNLLHEVIGEKADSKVGIPVESVPHIAIHNHPSGLTFTHTDLNNFAEEPNMRMLTAVGNNGAVYAVEKMDGFDADKFSKCLYLTMKSHPERMESPEKYGAFMKELLKGVGDSGIRYYTK